MLRTARVLVPLLVLAFGVTAEADSLPKCGARVKLRSWKGDYLHRPDSPQGVTTWTTGDGNIWTLECGVAGRIRLKSWKGDYLHRPDGGAAVTTWDTGEGNEWTPEFDGRVVKLKSWKGDYLHRPDGDPAVTTWDSGVGNEWVLEVVSE